MVRSKTIQRIKVPVVPITLMDFESLLQKAGFSDFKKGIKVAVAVSGGADSLALTLLLKDLFDKYDGQLVALTVDHGLRKESSKEAQDLHEMLVGLGVEHHILKWEGAKPKRALQEKARAKRYELLESWCEENGFSYLFLGHHQGDQSETFCMRLRRQSGLLGLACMRPVSKTQNVILVRPFLTTSKESLKEIVRQKDVAWVEDPSNENLDFERVFWRRYLKDETFDLEPFQGVRDAYEGWIQRYLNSYAMESDLGYVSLQKEVFLKLPQSFQSILLSHLIRAYGVGSYPLTSKSLEGILERMNSTSFSAVTASGLKISRAKNDILLVREYRAIDDKKDVSNKSFIWDKRFLIKTDGVPPGSIKAVGEKGWGELLKAYPELKNLEIPRAVLWSLPALWVKTEGVERIHLKFNMIYESFLCALSPNQQKRFVFRSKSPF